MKKLIVISVLAAAGVLAACDRKPKREVPPRPVLSMVIASQAISRDGFPGTVEPRFQSDLAFRVLGRVTERNVKIGDQVSKGQVLAALDPSALDFAVRASKADFESAKAQLDNATANEKRRQTLFQQGNLSAELFEAAAQARQAAEASLQRARTALDKAQEQRSYAELHAEFDGVVTGVFTEVGQVPTPGQKAISIAQPLVRDAVVDVSDDLAGALQIGQVFRIELQSGAAPAAKGLVREIAPQIDTLTHTQRIRVALQDAADDFRLGTLVMAYMEQVPQAAATRIPATALFEKDGKSFVWAVDPASETVSARAIEIGERGDQTISVRSGLEQGVRIVIAGVNSITPGQRVRILKADSP
jgi:RND family efflux transporter MFP subunit